MDEKPIEECWKRYTKQLTGVQLNGVMGEALRDAFYIGAHSVLEIVEDAMRNRGKTGDVKRAANKLHYAAVELNKHIEQRHGEIKNETQH